MATNPLHVNKASVRIEQPGISINGKRIDSTSGLIIATEDWTPNQDDVEQVGVDWSKMEERIFYADQNDWIVVTLIPDTKFPVNSYSPALSNYDGNQIGALSFQGPQQVVGNALGLASETYYSLNGKDPKRTKSNLYVRPFRIRRNTSGSDNIILKARTYRAGQWSTTRTLKIRIVRKVDTKV